jgi:hydrogenase small subunit
MKKINRRDFLKLSGAFATMMGLAPGAIPTLASTLEKLADGSIPVLWLQGLSCSGCSVSMLNCQNPEPVELLTRHIALKFHSTLSTATGEVAMDCIKEIIREGNYILAVEGAVPAGLPEACVIGHEPFTEQLLKAAKSCRAVVNVETCASFGGIPAAEGNSTGAVSVWDYLKSRNIHKPVINIPGCPCHPDWIVGTIAHVSGFGIPALDEKQRPKMFFKNIIHDQCFRFTDYERERFAMTFGEEGCLFHLGCQGPVTRSDCIMRDWNNGTNQCIKAGAPCIGCASEHFAKKKSYSFYPGKSS